MFCVILNLENTFIELNKGVVLSLINGVKIEILLLLEYDANHNKS